ncbi:MAG: serine hydrolase [Bacteroidota bacterium]
MNTKVLLPFLFAVLLVATSCEQELPIKANVPTFSIEIFADNLQAELDGKVPDYQVMIAEKGNLYEAWAEGNSIYAPDPGGDRVMTTNTRMNVASVSKFVGAVAMCRVLEQHNIGLDQPIHNYLPKSWKSQVHPDHWEAISPYTISFRNLMRMETGIDYVNSSMPSANTMLDALKKPAKPSRVGTYQNGNFTLIRILIGEIEFQLDEEDEDYNERTSRQYYRYINAHLFDPAGVQTVLRADLIDEVDLARAYQLPLNPNFQDDNGRLGWYGLPPNSFNSTASGGLFLNVMDLGALMAYVRYTEDIISAEMRTELLDNELGLYESVDGNHGRYLVKQGTRGADKYDRAYKSIVMMFPNDVEVALLINANFASSRTLLKQAYDAAWSN